MPKRKKREDQEDYSEYEKPAVIELPDKGMEEENEDQLFRNEWSEKLAKISEENKAAAPARGLANETMFQRLRSDLQKLKGFEKLPPSSDFITSHPKIKCSEKIEGITEVSQILCHDGKKATFITETGSKLACVFSEFGFGNEGLNPIPNILKYFRVFMCYRCVEEGFYCFRELFFWRPGAKIETDVLHSMIPKLNWHDHAEEIKIKDSSSEEESPLGQDLAIPLLYYQKQNISWMMKIEDPSNDEYRTLDVGPLYTLNFGDTGVQVAGVGLLLQPYSETSTVSNRIVAADRRLLLGGTYANRISDLGDKIKHHAVLFQPYSEKITIPGGILADDTGSGKTFTMLALVHCNPLRSINDIKRNYLVNWETPFPSKATIVLCPPNLIKQWYTEAVRLFGQNKKRMHYIMGLPDYRRISWDDFIHGDLIIVNYKFLLGHHYYPNKWKMENALPGLEPRKSVLAQQMEMPKFRSSCNVNFEFIHFHRVIFDEIHEQVPTIASKIKANWYWGLTGTPQLKDLNDIVKMATWVNGTSIQNLAALKFAELFIRRNAPDLSLPPLKHVVLKVIMTPAEKAMYTALNDEVDIKNRLMMCSHHQMLDSVVESVGLEPVTAEKAAELVQSSNEVRIKELETQIEIMKKDLAKLQVQLKALEELEQKLTDELDPKSPDEEVERMKGIIQWKQISLASSEKKLSSMKSDFQFFQKMLDVITGVTKEETKPECVICLEPIASSGSWKVCITRCGHGFCHKCFLSHKEQSKAVLKCPICTTVLKMDTDVFLLRDEVKVKKEEDANGIPKSKERVLFEKLSKYGSKIRMVVLGLQRIIENSPNNRVILFVQFRRLSELVSKALKEFSIANVRVQGTAFDRERAIRQFKESRDIKVIMLSAEDSVSGLNLTEATHIILLHPFYYGDLEMDDEEKALAAEKQGISRAYRLGLDHPLTVIRFIVKGTLEEAFYLKRKDKLELLKGVETIEK